MKRHLFIEKTILTSSPVSIKNRCTPEGYGSGSTFPSNLNSKGGSSLWCTNKGQRKGAVAFEG